MDLFNRKPVHKGTHCDECPSGSPDIRGNRYKCGNCIDYDLCGCCIDYTEHDKNHVFILIKRPTDTINADVPLLPGLLYGCKPKQLSPPSRFSKPAFSFTNTPPVFGNPVPFGAPSLEHKAGPLFSSLIEDQKKYDEKWPPFHSNTTTFGGKKDQPMVDGFSF